MKVFDLSMDVDENTPVFPGDQKQELTQKAFIEKDGWNEKRLSFNSHFSTHIDAPLHMIDGGKSLSDFPVEYLTGEAICIDVHGQKTIESALEGVKANDIVFFYTGKTEQPLENLYEDYPVLSRQTAEKLVETKVKIVGLDSWGPDGEPFSIHKILLGRNILIVENLVNLAPLAGKRFECFILPLKIRGGDGAPCRVIARL